MANLKQQLADVGISCTLTVLETGQLLSLNFKPGETSKLIRLVLGHETIEAKLTLVPESAPPEKPNVRLVIEMPGDRPVKAADTLKVEAKPAPAAVTPPPAPPVAPPPPTPVVPEVAKVAEPTPPTPEAPAPEATTPPAEPALPVEQPTSENIQLQGGRKNRR